MTLQQLRYVIMVAETGTITEAAGKLYISQPSLTNAIHELEKEMNLVIFNRTNRGISLSKEGEEHDVVALHPLEAGQRIAGHGGVAVADMQLIAGVIDGSGDIKCFVFAHGGLSSFLLVLQTKSAPALPGYNRTRTRALNLRGTTLLRCALADAAFSRQKTGLAR